MSFQENVLTSTHCDVCGVLSIPPNFKAEEMGLSSDDVTQEPLVSNIHERFAAKHDVKHKKDARHVCAPCARGLREFLKQHAGSKQKVLEVQF